MRAVAAIARAWTCAFLDRIAAIDPQLNAFLLVTADQAMDQARVAEAEIMAGRRRGPMHGIPFALKDIYCTKGIRTTSHSRTRADYVPDFDATTVTKLRDAGAVLLGKLSTHEFAHGGPSFDLPWPPARKIHGIGTAYVHRGGSSSGSGASGRRWSGGESLPLWAPDTGGINPQSGRVGGPDWVRTHLRFDQPERRLYARTPFSYDTAGPMTWTVEDCAILPGRDRRPRPESTPRPA